MKAFVSIFFLFFSCQTLFAQQYLEKQKERILALCNTSFSDSTCSHFTRAFDALYLAVNDSSLAQKKSLNLKQKLFFDLQEIDEKTIAFLHKKTAKYLNLNAYLKAVSQNNEDEFFSNLSAEKLIQLLPFLTESTALNQQLKTLSYSHGLVLLKEFDSFRDLSFNEKVLRYILHENPVLLKRYYTNKTIKNILLSSNYEPIQIFVKLYQELGASSKAFLLINDIIEQKISIKEAHEISENKQQLFEYLSILSGTENLIGKQAVDEELSFICAKRIRPINAAYEMHENSTRFKELDSYSAVELYTILVYSEEEIFTSSFTGGFNLLLQKIALDKQNGYSFLEKINFNAFRTFIKMCASYGLLESYLRTISIAEQEHLFTKFLALENNQYLLKNSVSIADALGSIEDEELDLFIANNLIAQYQSARDKNIKFAYGLLINLFEEKTENQQLTKIAKQYPMKSITQLDSTSLFGNDGIHTQLHLFYNDEDGMMSFATFLQTFKTPLWQIEDMHSYIKISSNTGAAVSIYANKAQYEKKGIEEILSRLNSSEVEVLVHRGHSFYVNKSLEKLHAETQVVLLGSCGGYHKVLQILEKAPDAQIIATKQVGSYVINNPLILQMAIDINEQKMIHWEKLWKQLYTKVSRNSYAKDKFNEYIPPHKNLGAAFIKAYKKSR